MDLIKKPYVSLFICVIGGVLLTLRSFVDLYGTFTISQITLADITLIGDGMLFGALAYISLTRRLLNKDKKMNGDRFVEYIFIAVLAISFISGLVGKFAGHHLFSVIPLMAIGIYFWTQMTFVSKK